MHHLPISAAIAVSLFVGLMTTSAVLPGHLGPGEANARRESGAVCGYGKLHEAYGREHDWATHRRAQCRQRFAALCSVTAARNRGAMTWSPDLEVQPGSNEVEGMPASAPVARRCVLRRRDAWSFRRSGCRVRDRRCLQRLHCRKFLGLFLVSLKLAIGSSFGLRHQICLCDQ